VTRVLVIASSAIVRAGLVSLLQRANAIEVVGDVAAWGEYSGEDPDVILAESESDAEELPLELTRGESAYAVVMLADDPRLSETAEALRSGVRAVLPRQSSGPQIVAAVEAASAGLVVLHPADLDALLINPRPERGAEPLTPREIEVLGMLAEGQSNKAIAHRLNISEHTVKFHVTSIMSKLNAGSRTEAVTLGIRQGLIMI
jgi:NarL family two-component system response regulator YdfI